jgi:FixJ family two-component response regulator
MPIAWNPRRRTDRFAHRIAHGDREESMSVAAKSGSTVPAVRPQILVVDDEPELVELLADVARSMDCRVLTAGTLGEARKTLAREAVQLLVADLRLPDGDGLSLLPALRKKNPAASAIVITGDATVASATAALRSGAVDFIPKPFDARQIVAHVRSALAAHEQAARAERKLKKLKSAVRKLNDARKTISQKVDILCNDLVSAYGELSKQFDTVRTQEAFRKTIEPARDLEQLICQAMDWLMRQVGYSNVAVWLVGEDGSHQLGAYMKYTIPGDEPVAEMLRRVVLPLASRDGRDTPVRLDVDDLIGKISPAEGELFRDQQFLAMDCTYLGEDLAALVFFRDGQIPFSEQDVETLRSVGPIFAQSLANIVRGGGTEDADHEPTGPDDEHHESDGPPPPPSNRRKSGKPDPADWWKRGEAPPF